jgi:hypothetical protein
MKSRTETYAAGVVIIMSFDFAARGTRDWVRPTICAGRNKGLRSKSDDDNNDDGSDDDDDDADE